MTWFIYMVMGKDKKIYTGITTDVTRRLEEHKSTGAKGAKFLRGKSPLELLMAMPVGNRSDALRVEHWVKRLSRSKKDDIVREPAILKSMIEKGKER